MANTSSDSYKYEHMSAAERDAAIDARLGGLERDRFNAQLDVIAAGANGNPAQEQRVAELDERIAAVKALRSDAASDNASK